MSKAKIGRTAAPINPSPYNSLAIALAYLRQNPWRYLFPLGADKGKPCITDNLAQASNDPAQIKRWSLQFRNPWWGLSHRKSGLMPIDFDPRHGSAATVKMLADQGKHFPDTETNRTPGGGTHKIYSCPPGFVHHFTAGEKSRIGHGIDSPNYTVIPGCGNYTSICLSPDEPLDMELPQWIMDIWADVPDRPRAPTADPIALELFKRMLDKTPYEGRYHYSEWLEFAMSCHEAAGGDEAEYMHAFIDWSLADPSPDWEHETSFEVVERKWCSFTADPAPGAKAITRGSWIKALKDLGHVDLGNEAVTISSAEEDFAGEVVEDDLLADANNPAIAARIKRTEERRELKAEQGTPETWFSLRERWAYVGQQKRFVRIHDGGLWDKQAFVDQFANLRVPDKDPRSNIASHIFRLPCGAGLPMFDTFCYRPGLGRSVGGALNLYSKGNIDRVRATRRYGMRTLSFCSPMRPIAS